MHLAAHCQIRPRQRVGQWPTLRCHGASRRPSNTGGISSPEQFEQQLALALAHWFNHQTHHCGQVHTVLTGLTGQVPELDLLLFQRLAVNQPRLAIAP
jgi:uncharacterized damage-inducible protein DinB